MSCRYFRYAITIFACQLFAAGAHATALIGNHIQLTGLISTLGGVDSYTFHLNAGESVQIRMADPNHVDTSGTDLYPYIQLIEPGGATTTRGGYVVAAIRNFTANVSGTHEILLSSGYAGGPGANATGPYNLYFARMPGANELGSLADDDYRAGNIDLGDIDTYTFTGNAGESIQLRLADPNHVNTSDFYPYIHVYDPEGNLETEAGGYVVASIRHHVLLKNGTYTVALSAGRANGLTATTGSYQFYFARIPGANELGNLSASDFRTESIDLGDIDTWTFSASAGGTLSFVMTDLLTPNTDLYCNVMVYGPDGTRLAQEGGYTTATLNNFPLPATGVYTVVATAGHGNGATATTGDYTLDITYTSNIIADGDVAPLGAPDGLVNGADVLVATRITLGLLTAGSLELLHGDMNGDGVLNLSDLVVITGLAIN